MKIRRTSIGKTVIMRAVPSKACAATTLLAGVDDGDARAAALGPLVHGVDRDEHRRIADRGGGDAADRAFGMAMPGHIGIVEHDLAAAPQLAGAIGLALHEAINEPPLEIFGARPLG